MSKKSLKASGKAPLDAIDWAVVDASAGADKPDENSPELTRADVPALKPWGEVLPGLGGHKTRITIMLDDEVLQAYKARAGGKGYQTLINDALRRALEMEGIKDALRQVLQEERGHYKP